MDSNGNNRYEAYCAFMRRHYEMVWRICWNFAGRKGLKIQRSTQMGYDDRMARTKDLAQEVWIVLWQKFNQLDFSAPERQQRRWLERLAESTIIDLYRRENPMPEALTDEMAECIADADSKQKAEELEEVMANLGPEERKLMRLYIEGYRGDEIAAIMGIKRNAVYLRIHRAVSKARRMVLLVLLAVVASAIAVAVVPQWREWVFPGLVNKDTSLEEHIEPQKFAPVFDTLPEVVIDTPDNRPKLVPIHKIPHLYEMTNPCGADSASTSRPILSASIGNPCGCPDNHARRAQKDINDSIDDPCEPETEDLPEVTITINGNIVMVDGVDNEMVSVFDGQGRLVARSQCYGYCTLTIGSDFSSVSGSNPAPYWVQVGSRPRQQVFLHFPPTRFGF